MTTNRFPRVLVIATPAIIDDARTIFTGVMGLSQPVTLGPIGSVRQVDGYATFDSTVTNDLYQRVIDQTLVAEDYPGIDLAAVYAGLTIVWYPLDPKGMPDFETVLAAEGYNLTPPEPSPDDIAAEASRRVRAGTVVSVTGIGDVAVSGSPAMQRRMMAIQIAGQGGTIPDVNGAPVVLTAAQATEVFLGGVAASQHMENLARDYIANGAPNDWQTNDTYWAV